MTVTMAIMMVTTATTMTRGKCQPAAVQERRDETGIGVTIDVTALRERRGRIERDDDDGDDDHGEKDNQNNQFQIFFPLDPKQKRHHNLFSIGVRLHYWCHGKHIVTALKRA